MRFQFRLERLLGLRRSQLSRAEWQIGQTLSQLESIRTEQLALKERRVEAAARLVTGKPVGGGELAALAGFYGRLHKDSRELDQTRELRTRELEHQRGKALEVRRQVRLLERLRERHFQAWQEETDRRVETLAADIALTQWTRNAVALRAFANPSAH